MKRVFPGAVLVVVLAAMAVATALAAAEKETKAADRSPAAPVASALTAVTGIAISPLLGTGGYGAYQWMTAKDAAARAALPWFAQATFWVPALLLVGVCAAKDAFGTALPPGMKKPLDVLETLENKVSGLVAAGAVVPLTVAGLSKLLAGTKLATTGLAVPTGLAMLPVATVDFSWALSVLTVPFGVAMFAIVWMASHAINVLILLSPWGAIDAALKGMRTALLGVLTVTATFDPWLAAGLSVVTILVSYLVAGWAWRLTVFGSVFCWDFFTLRRTRFAPAADGNWMFAGGNLRGVPVRAYGQLERTEAGGCAFAFRAWPWRSRKTVAVEPKPAELAVGKGLFLSTIAADDTGTLFVLPPRYRGHEEAVADAYELGGGVRPAGLRKAWGMLRELFGGGVARTQVG